MYTYLVSSLIALFYVVGCHCFFGIFGRRKQRAVGITVLCYILLYVLFYLAAIMPISFIIIKLLIIYLATVSIMNFPGVAKNAALWFVSGWYASQYLILELLFCGIKDIFAGCSIVSFELAGIIQTIVICLICILWVGGVLLLQKKLGRRTGILLENKEWYIFIAVPVISILAVLYVFYKRVITDAVISWDVYLAVTLGVFLFQVFAFIIYNFIAVKEINNLELVFRQNSLEQRVQLQQDIYIKAERQRVRAHDFMTHLVSMRYIIEAKQYDELEKYIKSQIGSMRTDWTSFDTENIVVNAILNTKYCEARDKGIFVRIEHNKLKDMCIEKEDMAVILANLFNNAIEAAQQCIDEKVIRIKIFLEDKQLYIWVSNTHMNMVKCKDNIFYTTKKEQADEHGFGIRNIKAVVEKYKGQYDIRYDEAEFVFEIKIPMN